MAKKLFLAIFLSVPVLLFVAMAGEGSGDTSDGSTRPEQADVSALFEEAEAYESEGFYEHAEGIYRQIITENIATDHAFAAERKLTALYVVWYRQEDARWELEEMLTDFSDHERLPHAIHEIAEECCKKGRGNEVKQLLISTLEGQPQSTEAIWLKMGVAISNVNIEDYDAAAIEATDLIAEFCSDNRISEAVAQVAWSYCRKGEYEFARIFYQHVVDSCPDRYRAIFSLRGVVLTSIALGDYSTAEAGVEQLLEQYSEDEHLAEVVCRVAQAYHDEARYDKANELYRYVATHWPQSGRAVEVERGIALSSIGLGDYEKAQAAVETLISDFAQDEGTSDALYDIARELDKRPNVIHRPPFSLAANQGRSTSEVYQYIIANYPDNDSVVLSMAQIACIFIRSGDLDLAQGISDRLSADFSGEPILPEAISIIGEEYYKQALVLERRGYPAVAEWLYRKTITECERVVTRLPEDYDTTAGCCYSQAACHERLGEYSNAIEHYQMVVDNWPDYKYAWNAFFRIGRCYQELSKSGAMLESEAATNVQAVYEQLLQEYPNCQVAGVVRRCLGRPNTANKGERR